MDSFYKQQVSNNTAGMPLLCWRMQDLSVAQSMSSVGLCLLVCRNRNKNSADVPYTLQRGKSQGRAMLWRPELSRLFLLTAPDVLPEVLTIQKLENELFMMVLKTDIGNS